MRKNTSLTIVIPAYNEAVILRSCLDAIQNQTIRPDEVIIVNNNSSDDTVDIAKSYPFVRVLHEKRQGISQAHKKGFDNAKSEFIARIDVDSVLPKDFVHNICNFYAKDVNHSTCLRGSGYAIGTRSKFVQVLGNLAFYVTDIVVGHKPLWGPCMVVPSTCWKRVRSQLCEELPYTFDDLELSLHVHEAGFKTVWLKNLRVGIRLRHTSSLKKFIYYYLRMPRTLKHHGSQRWLLATPIALSSALAYPFFKMINNKAEN